MSHAKISVLILTWNRKEELQLSLRSVFQQTMQKVEVVVVDSASTDGTRELIAEQFPQVKYIRLPYNLGVVGGRNMGIANCSGELVFFLDDDAILLENDALERVAREFEQDPRLAVLYCKILNAEGQITPWEFRGSTEVYADKELVGYSFIGAAHCIRNSLFDELGYMDASYFREGEEIDFSLRAYGAGYYVLYYPHVTVLHRESQITRNPSGQSRGYLFRNRILNKWKYLPISHAMAFTLWHLFIWMVRLLKMGHFRWYLWGLLQLPILIPLTVLRKRRPVPKEHLGLWYKAYSEVLERKQLNTPQAQSGSLSGYVRSYLRKISPLRLITTNT